MCIATTQDCYYLNLLTTQPDTLCHRNFILLIVVPCKAFGVVSPSCLEGYPAPTHVVGRIRCEARTFCSTSPEGVLRPRLFTDMSRAVSDYRCRSAYVRNAAADRICSHNRGRAQRAPSQGRALRLGGGRSKDGWKMKAKNAKSVSPGFEPGSAR